MWIVATKLRLQNKVWWTENDKDAKRYVWSCHGSQLVGQPTSPEPLMPTAPPHGKWKDLRLEILGRCHMGNTFLSLLTITPDNMK